MRTWHDASPDRWLVSGISQIPGYEDAKSAKWAGGKIPPNYAEYTLAACSCGAPLRRIADPTTPPPEFVRMPQFEIKRLPVVADGRQQYIWLGRCPSCRTITLAGPAHVPAQYL